MRPEEGGLVARYVQSFRTSLADGHVQFDVKSETLRVFRAGRWCPDVAKREMWMSSFNLVPCAERESADSLSDS